jgi:hypothetical protein
MKKCSPMLDHSCQVQRHSHSERGLDLYETLDVAVEALLRVEKLPPLLWEPACGPGRIVRVLERAGHAVCASDIEKYGEGHAVCDFFEFTALPFACDTIVTNPPYQWAEKFVRHALKLCPERVIMLLRLAFLESQRRTDILENAGLARVYVFRKRLPMMHRAGWEGRKSNSGMAFAWFVWERGHEDPTTLHRISWEK